MSKTIVKKLLKLLENESVQKAITSIVVVVISLLIVTFSYNKILPKEKSKVIHTEPEINADQIKKSITVQPNKMEELSSMKFVTIYPKGLTTPQSLMDVCIDANGNRDNNKCNEEIAKITKTLVRKDFIKKAYLYVKAGTSRDNGPLVTLDKNYDSIWFFLDKVEHSGQLLRSKALYRGQSEDGLTQLIYDLSDVSFTGVPYNDNAAPDQRKDSNLLKTLNSYENHIISSFVATLGYGKLQELKIYYEGGLLEVL